MLKIAPSVTANHYRPDIDGLRALAILLVIIFHAFPKFLRGGFIGVDIFFVISGYLITGIIIKEQRQGCFSLLDFYSRRIKRIFPSLILVLVFCLVAGWFILLDGEYKTLAKHIAGGSLYISNFVLQSESGYFDTQADYKPLLHLWSLSIEEQFYLFFPLLLIITHRYNINYFYIISIFLFISFSLNIASINSYSTEVFFYPHTRAWELLVGSFIACINIYGTQPINADIKKFLLINTKNIEHIISWLGILLIAYSWYYFDSKKILFPSWWALIPTLGAACIIMAGENAWFNKNILSHKIAVFIGIISYPLYLWHWVLLSFIKITEINEPRSPIKISILLISFVLAWITYYFLERKIRFLKIKLTSIILFILLIGIGFFGYLTWQNKTHSVFYKKNTESYNNIAIKTPALSKECHIKFPNADFCLIQNSKLAPTALLIGDSHAHHLYDGLVSHSSITGGNLLNLAVGDCFPFFDNPDYPNKKCRPLINQALDIAISTPSVKTIILASRALTGLNEHIFSPKKQFFNGLNTQVQPTDPYITFKKGMENTLQRLTTTHKKIIFVLDIPDLEFEPTACIKRPWRLSGQLIKTPCAVSRLQVDDRRKKYVNLVYNVLKNFPYVTLWDTLPTLCDQTYCWAIKEGKILYNDSNHLNTNGAIYLSNNL